MRDRCFTLFPTGILILGMLYPVITCADETINKLWNVLTLKGSQGKWLYQVQPQLRLADKPVLFEQSLLLSELGYQFTQDFSLSLGYRGSYIGPAPRRLASLDYGLYLQAQLALKKKDQLLVFSLSRMEERQRHNLPGRAFRIRERIGINQGLTQFITLAVYDEVFINLNKPVWIRSSTLAENRFYIGISQKITPQIDLGLGYLNQLIFSNPNISGQVAVITLTINSSRKDPGLEPLEEPGS